MLDQLTSSPGTVLQVVVATLAVYLAFVALVRLAGPRTLATLSVLDLGCVLALGAVVGRTALLAEPSLVTGLVALVTLLVAQRLTSRLARRTAVGRWLHPAPVVLVRGGRLVEDNLLRARVSDDELRQHLRLAGATTLAEVELAVLERTGQISVLRQSAVLDPWLVADLEVAPPAPEAP